MEFMDELQLVEKLVQKNLSRHDDVSHQTRDDADIFYDWRREFIEDIMFHD
jgi:hypothetical protein